MFSKRSEEGLSLPRAAVRIEKSRPIPGRDLGPLAVVFEVANALCDEVGFVLSRGMVAEVRAAFFITGDTGLADGEAFGLEAMRTRVEHASCSGDTADDESLVSVDGIDLEMTREVLRE